MQFHEAPTFVDRAGWGFDAVPNRQDISQLQRPDLGPIIAAGLKDRPVDP